MGSKQGSRWTYVASRAFKFLTLVRFKSNKKHFSLLQGQRSTWDPCCMTSNVHLSATYRVTLVFSDRLTCLWESRPNHELWPPIPGVPVRMGPRYFRVIYDLTQATPGPSIIKIFYSPIEPSLVKFKSRGYKSKVRNRKTGWGFHAQRASCFFSSFPKKIDLELCCQSHCHH